MKTVALGAIAELNPTKPKGLQPDHLCSFVPMEAVDDYLGAITKPVEKQIGEVNQGYTYFANDDVLFAKITPCMENGKCAIARDLVNGVGFGSTEFHVVRAHEDVMPEWIYYFLRQENVRQEAVRHMTGSAGQQRVPTTFLRNLPIPLPPLAEQQCIAGLLRRADRLRRLRRYALDVSAGYLQAVFVEMFGDYILKSQASTRMGELVTITGGGTPSRGIERYFEGDIPWLTSKDMQGDYIWDTQEHITEEAIRNSATKLVPAGSILVVVKSKVLMRRLPLAITKRPLCHGQDIKSIQCSERVHPLYLVQVLKKNEQRLLMQARGANTEGLTLPMLWDVPVPVAPMALQLQFAEIVERFERLQIQQREALHQAEHLFQALLRRTFAG